MFIERAEPLKRALVCAPLLPEFDREGGSRRIYHFIRFLREAGWSVSFLCENAMRGKERYVQVLQQMGVATYIGFGDEAAEAVEAGRFDLAILAFWHVAESRAEWIANLSPETAIVVESVDLHWLRNARRAYADGEAGALDEDFAGEMIREMNVYARADAVFTVSEKEANMINDIVASAVQAIAVPDCDFVPPSPRRFEEREGMLFVGNFRHPPNQDAVAFLCREILPELSPTLRRKHPLYVVGNGLDRRVAQLADGIEGVRMVGWVPSVVPYLQQARVSVVPLRYGAGTKRKLMQAMMAETPSVTTTIGIEGFELENGEGALIADDPRDFASILEQLLGDPDLWSRVARAGSRRIHELHGPATVKRRFFEAVGTALEVRAQRAARMTSRSVLPSRRQQELDGIRRVAKATLAPGARVLVVSRGDPELLVLEDCAAAHFPQAEDGRYAGYHPKDSRTAIEHLEEFRHHDAADYLMFPGTAFWWLEHYSGFARYLDESHTKIWSDEHCLIYRLNGAGSL